MANKKRPKSRVVARRPADPKAQKSGSGFHTEAKYSKRDRAAGKRRPDDE